MTEVEFHASLMADTDGRRADIVAYFAACYGDQAGKAFTPIGRGPHWSEAGKYGHTEFRGNVSIDYPAEIDSDKVDKIITAAETADVYACPNLMYKARTPGSLVGAMVAHADWDGDPADAAEVLDKVTALSGFAVASGTPGHIHVYIPLATSVHSAEASRLSKALQTHLPPGSDPGKHTVNDLLRLPGTYNHKSVGVTGTPTSVEWLVRPGPVRWDPAALAERLGVAHHLVDHRRDDVHVHVADRPAPRPIPLDDHPDIRAALDKVTGDRSEDTYRLVAACIDAGLGGDLERIRAVVTSRADLAERLAGRNDDDVLTCWYKVQVGLREQAQVLDDPRPDGAGDIEKHSGHLGMAVKMAEQFAGKLLYVNGIGWYRWDGKRWARDGNGTARRAVHKVIKRHRRIIRSLRLSAEEEQKALRQIARYETAAAISGILTEAAALEVFSVAVGDLDADPHLFNCANGTLDLRTMELRAHDPADRITKVAAAAYRPEAGAGTAWIKFLEQVLPDPGVRDYLQRVYGVALLGEVNGDKQILPIMIGGGANGKTTAIEAVCHALGDYAMTAEPTLLMEKRGDAHPTGIADLQGRRFVSVCETEQRRRFDITLVKWLTGGDTIKARLMRQDYFSFTPSHLLMLATNHLPRIDDDTEAVWRRIRVIPFTVQIPKADRDKHLRDTLRAEADAVLTWIVGGWRDYRRRGGLDEPDAVMVATDDYKADSDAVGRFIVDECQTGGAQSAATTQRLYERWEVWAAQDGCLPLSRIVFGRALDAKGYPADKNTHDRLRRRICLKTTEMQVNG